MMALGGGSLFLFPGALEVSGSPVEESLPKLDPTVTILLSASDRGSQDRTQAMR